MEKPTISKLFSHAARLLRAEFEYIRLSNPHSAEKGSEIENALKTFLNSHLPQRFRASSGIIIDNDNNISKQTDVIIYDALSSPVYRYSEKTQIVPINSVASVIEVKTRLNKKELKDAYAKIASCKKLNKTPKTSMDQKATGSDLTTVGTLGIVFGFDTDISLEALADEAKSLNKTYESRLWPNMIAVLDKGVINYALSFPGDKNLSGELAPPCDENFKIPPFYIHLVIQEDKEYTLNRFFTSLLSHLTFYPHRPNMVPFDVMMEGAPNTAMTIISYQYNTQRQLVPTPSSLYLENNPSQLLSMKISAKVGKQIGLLQYMPWQDGAALRWFGQVPLEVILSLLIPDFDGFVMLTNKPNCQLTSVFKLTEDQFKTWPNLLSKNSDLSAILE